MTKDTSSKCYMLDTNIFDALAKGRLSLDRLPSDGELRATRVQLEELKNTENNHLRSQLLTTFTEIIAHDSIIPSAFALGVAGAGLNEGVWRSDGGLWNAVKQDLDDEWAKMPTKKQKKSRRENNPKDSSIAEAAKSNDYILLTCDRNLAIVAEKHGIKVRLFTPDGSS